MRLRGVLMIVSFYWWTLLKTREAGKDKYLAIASHHSGPCTWKLCVCNYVFWLNVIFLLFEKPVRYILGARTWTLGHKRFLFTPSIEEKCDSLGHQTTKTCTLYAGCPTQEIKWWRDKRMRMWGSEAKHHHSPLGENSSDWYRDQWGVPK